MNKLEEGQGRPNNPESTAQRNANPQERVEPQRERAGSSLLVSPVEQKGSVKLSPTPEGEGQEEKFEVTEREKYLLEIVANVVAESYIPKFGSAIRQEHMKEILLSHINRRTKIVPS
jgi:hypothetical protein